MELVFYLPFGFHGNTCIIQKTCHWRMALTSEPPHKAGEKFQRCALEMHIKMRAATGNCSHFSLPKPCVKTEIAFFGKTNFSCGWHLWMRGPIFPSGSWGKHLSSSCTGVAVAKLIGPTQSSFILKDLALAPKKSQESVARAHSAGFRFSGKPKRKAFHCKPLSVVFSGAGCGPLLVA